MYAIGLMAFILFLSALVGVPVLADLSKQLGAGQTATAVVMSCALATVVVAQFFTGALADRMSRRTLVLTGAMAGAMSSFLCAMATHWTQLLAFRILGGVADAIAMPALLAITASLAKDQPGKSFGILRSSQGLSFVLGPAIGSALSLASLRMPFLVDGALSLLAFAAALVLIKDGPCAKREHDLSVFRGLKAVFSNKRMYLYVLMGVSGLFGFGVLSNFIPVKAQTIGLTPWRIGMILSSGALIFSLVAYSTGVLSDRFGRVRFVIGAQVLIMAGGLGLALSSSFAGLLVFYGLFCIGETVTYLLSFVYAKEAFPEERIGASMGAFDSLIDLSLLLGPLAGILMLRLSGRFGPVFLIGVAPAALAFVVMAVWRRRVFARG